MRVVLTCNFSPWSSYRGGGQVSTHRLATALAELGHDAHVVFTKSPLERLQVPQDLPYALTFAPFVALKSRRNAVLRPLNALPVAAVVKHLVGARSDAVVHSQGEEGVLVPTLLPRTPWILTPRYPSYPESLREPMSGVDRALLWALHTKYMLLRRYARQARFVCPTSDAAARSIEHALHVARERIRVVPNGVEPAFTSLVREPPAPDAPIVFFGRIEQSKGVDVLLEAYLQLRSPPPLLLIGEGDYAAMIAQRLAGTAAATRVTLRPWQSPQVLAHTLAGPRCALLPSREESFGNAMVEAMAVGVPLITTDVGALPEVTKNGELATLVPGGDAPALVAALGELLHDPAAAEQRAARAREAIIERFTWGASAQLLVRLYAEALTH